MTTTRRSFWLRLLATPRHLSPRRHDLLCIVAALCVLPILSGCTEDSPNDPGPSGTQLITIAFSGKFDMTNVALPQRTPHSYDYGVQWKYQWNGSWDQLFGGGRTNSGQMTFQVIDISGTVDATYRETANGPDIHCTMTIAPDPANPPTFIATYDASQRVVRVTNVEAPTFRYATITSADSMCAGGPGVNIFSPPSDWNPLGPGGGTAPEAGGKEDFDRRWEWTHTFAGGEVRNYDATMHTTLEVLIP